MRQAAPDAPAFRRFAVAAVCAATARADAVFAPRDGKHTGRRDPVASRSHVDPAVGQGDISSAAAGGRRGQPDTSAGERQPAVADNKALLPDETVPPGGDGDIAPVHGQAAPAADGIGVGGGNGKAAAAGNEQVAGRPDDGILAGAAGIQIIFTIGEGAFGSLLQQHHHGTRPL